MKKTLIATSVCMLTFVGIIASIASQHQDFINQVFAVTIPCESGVLSYDEAKDAMTNGELLISLSPPNLSANAVAVNVTNNTRCSLSASLGSYKMFGPYSLSTQSQQEFFAGTPVMNIAAGATGSLSINIPACAAQYDLWFGAVPHTLVDNQPYGSLLTGDQVRSDNLCVQPVSTLNVIKLVLNQNGHTKVASDFTFHVKKGGIDVAGSPAQAAVDPGTTYTLVPGNYTFSEIADASYTQRFSGNCDASGNITLNAGDHLICTIINIDIPIPVVIPPVVIPPVVVPPLLSITTVVDEPLAPEPVADEPVAAIVSVVPAIVVPIIPVVPVILAVAPLVIPAVVPIIPVALVTPIAPVILAVAPPIAQSVSLGGGGGPSISITKVPSPTELPNGPGLVTYAYTVVNENNQLDLTDVSVVDDKCGPSMFISGDRNNNGKLDPREQWIYHCTTRLTQTTTNTAVAIGYSDNPAHQPATATAVATVVVGMATLTSSVRADVPEAVILYSPDFPNTGFAPDCTDKINKCVSR